MDKQALEEKALSLLKSGQIDAARDMYLQLVELDPGKAPGLHDLGTFYMELGRKEEARDLLELSLRYDPTLTPSHYALAMTGKYRAGDDHLESMLRLADDLQVDNLQRSYLGLAIAKAQQDVGDYPAAGVWLREANRLRRAYYPYPAQEVAIGMLEIKQWFTAERCQPVSQHQAAITPVFIVGMPRSGTTLTEQILDCHQQVTGIGESNYFGERFTALSKKLAKGFPAWMDSVSVEALRALGEDYLAYVTERAPGASVVVEKTPFNFHFVGVICAALPNARFIHCSRDSRDTSLSIYQRSFHKGEHRYAYNQLELAQFHHLYEDLMIHWQRVVPEVLLRQRYEDLVADFEPGVRSLLDFVGLEFDAACLSPHENRRAVATASVDQVRQPLYASSVGSWNAFASELPVLLAALAQPALQVLQPDNSEQTLQSAISDCPGADDEQIERLLLLATAQPLYPPARRELALLLQKSGRYSEALEHAEIAAELEPDQAARHYQLGRVFYRLRNWSSAAAALRSALQLRENAVRSKGLLAFIYCLKKDYPQAVRYAREALASDQAEVYALVALARCIAQQGRDKECCQLLDDAWDQQIDDPLLALVAGESLVYLSFYERAQVWYQLACLEEGAGHLQPLADALGIDISDAL